MGSHGPNDSSYAREGSDQTVDAQAYKCLHQVDMPSCTFN